MRRNEVTNVYQSRGAAIFEAYLFFSYENDICEMTLGSAAQASAWRPRLARLQAIGVAVSYNRRAGNHQY